MKRKVCIKCGSRRSIDKFYDIPGKADGKANTCKECYLNDQFLRRQIANYKPLNQGNKTCSKCKKEKSILEFRKNKSCKDGRSSWCNDCHIASAAKSKAAKGESYQPYSETHPDNWKAYYNRYKRSYACDPINAKRLAFAGNVHRLKSQGKITPPDNCCKCGSKCKPKAYIPDTLVIYGLSNRVPSDLLIKSIGWQCNDCIYKRRQ